MNVVLCGMMGCGKTTVASALSEKYGLEQVDTDALIVRRHGVINDIFAQYGEEYFRDLETAVAKEVACTKDHCVISLGGGCVLRAQNVEALKKSGKIIFLRARLETLVNRVEGDSSRPLLKGGAREKLASLLTVRTPIYERVADFIVDTDGLTPAQIADKIMQTVN